MPSLSPDLIAKARILAGSATAVDVAKALGCSPETVRRLWRGETHRGGGAALAAQVTEPEAEASMGRFLEALRGGEDEQGGDDEGPPSVFGEDEAG